jgi:hypothetical protein
MRFRWPIFLLPFGYLILVLIVGGCIQDGGVTPEPTDDLGRAVKASRQYHRLLGDQFLEAGKMVESGELDTDRKASNFLEERNGAARDAAFGGVNKVLESRIGGGSWDRIAAAKLYREIGEELSK